MDLLLWTYYYGPTTMDLLIWTYYSGPTTMDLLLWTYYSGPTTMDLLLWTYYYGPTTMDLRPWTYYLFSCLARKPTNFYGPTLCAAFGQEQAIWVSYAWREKKTKPQKSPNQTQKQKNTKQNTKKIGCLSDLLYQTLEWQLASASRYPRYPL